MQNTSARSFVQKIINTGLIKSSANKSVTPHGKTVDPSKIRDLQTRFQEQINRLINQIQNNKVNLSEGMDLQETISNILSVVNETPEMDEFEHDKALTAIMFTLFMIANHSDIQQRIFEKITLKTEDNDCEMYLNAVVKEALRLYPPVSVIECVLGEEIIIGANIFFIHFLQTFSIATDYYYCDIYVHSLLFAIIIHDTYKIYRKFVVWK